MTTLAHTEPVGSAGRVRKATGHDPSELIQVTVVVRARTPRDKRRKIIEELALLPPRQRRYLDRREFIAQHGATAEDLAAVAAFARRQGLEVVEASSGRRCVVLSGAVEQFDQAFGVESGLYESAAGTHRSHEGSIHLPGRLSGIVLGVLGLDNRPLTSGRWRVDPAPEPEPFPVRYTDRRAVMAAYNFPVEADGGGQRVGVIALGGGFHESDLEQFLGPGRKVDVVELDGQRQEPADSELVQVVWDGMQQMWAGIQWSGEGLEGDDAAKMAAVDSFKWTMEVTGDLANVAAFAPAADLVVYFAPATMQGKYTAFTTALIDEYSPQVISCSWGDRESGVSKSHAWLMDDVFSFAALRGVTICFSSGDDGDGSQPMNEAAPEQPISAHFPATSPYVLACGGTMREGPEGTAQVWDEHLGVIHYASGGGVSHIFGPPWWQPVELVEERAQGRSGRGFPDVAGKADMQTGLPIRVAGVEMPMGGTSSVAPIWAALIARLNQQLGASVGYLNPLLYQERQRFAAATSPVTQGSNGAYKAAPGWDPCTGWGTPDGEGLLKALGGDS